MITASTVIPPAGIRERTPQRLKRIRAGRAFIARICYSPGDYAELYDAFPDNPGHYIWVLRGFGLVNSHETNSINYLVVATVRVIKAGSSHGANDRTAQAQAGGHIQQVLVECLSTGEKRQISAAWLRPLPDPLLW